MFWNRKSSDKRAKTLFTIADDDMQVAKRRAVRVEPTSKFPVTVKYDEQELEVKDISAVGISFTQTSFISGNDYHLTIELKGIMASTKVLVTVVANDEKGTRCSFRDIPQNITDLIHLYALKVQKEEIMQAKINKTMEW